MTHHRFSPARALLLSAGVFALFFVLLASPTLAESFTFSGKITTPTGGLYADGGWVNMYNSTSGYGAGIDTDGSFIITGAQAGTYTLEVNIATSSVYASPATQQVTVTADVKGFSVKAAAPVLKGVLATPSGAPSAGCVNVHNSTWTINRNSCAGTDGAFKIGGLDAGKYTLEASPNSPSDYVTSEQNVTIDPSTTLDLGTVKFDAPFITGKVSLPDGTALSWNDDWNQRVHLSVDMWNSDYTINKHSDYDQNSTFKFGQVPAGTYTVHVNVWDTKLYTGSANVGVTVDTTALDVGTVRLTTPQLSGVIYEPDGTTPVSNANINIHSEDWTINQGSNSDSNGNYNIGGGLAAGTYRIEINPPQDRQDLSRIEGEIAITSALTAKNYTFSRASKFIKGAVKKSDDTPVACANVNANKRGGSGWAGTTTGSDGSFTLSVASGSWGVNVQPSNSWECAAADWVNSAQDAFVEFSEDTTEQTETVNFTVTKTTAKIKGTVKAKTGTALTNGSVNANAQLKDGRNFWTNGQIKADGTYTINLIGGKYRLDVWTQDRRLFADSVEVTVNDNETATVNFTMDAKLARITGTVTDKAGKALPNVRINGNRNCGTGGCSGWSDTTTDSNGTYELAASIGRWNLNVDTSQGNLPYVYSGQQKEITLTGETETIADVDFALTYADVTITGNVIDEDGKKFADFPGWAYARPLAVTEGNGWQEYGSPVNGGKFTIRAPSSLFSQAELGVHMGPNSQYTAVPATVTLTADAAISMDITVKKNDAAIVGQLLDASGLPLGKVNFRCEVFANTEGGNGWHGTQVNGDGSYEISLVAGTYRMGYHCDESSGVLNRPPQDDKVEVASGTRTERNLKVLVGNARIKVIVLQPNGKPVDRVWLWADNNKEMDDARRQGEEQESDENFRGPGDTKSPEEVFAYCSKAENEKECADFKLPPGSEGPGGCTDALACTKYCKENKNKCEADLNKDPTKDVAAKSVTASALRRKASLASLKLVRAQGETEDAGQDIFDNIISSGAETINGTGTISVMNGHKYTVGAGLPPDSNYIPPKMQSVNLTDANEASVTLTLQEADGKMSGFVRYNDKPVTQGWVGCWGEDGTNTGAEIRNGTYVLNYAFNSVLHCNANANDGSTFLHSDDTVVTIGEKKKTRQDFMLGKASYEIPQSLSESWDPTSPHVITLGDGTSINVPANAIATSGTVTVTANPTVSVQNEVTWRTTGYGYNFMATDADGKEISTFPSNITACFTYTDERLQEFGVAEDSLVPSFWDSASKAWKQPSNITQDKDSNTICVTTNHFSTYAVTGRGSKGKGGQLTQVMVKKAKNGVQQIVIGTGSKAKKITPFKGYKSGLSIATGNVKHAGQIILAVQSSGTNDATTLKMFSLKGKPLQTTKLWGAGYRDGGNVQAEDVTGDGYADAIAAPNSGTTAYVLNISTRKTHALKTGGNGRIIAQALDLLRRGDNQLVTAVGTTIKTFKYNSKKKSFAAFSFDTRKLAVRESSVERVTLQPSVGSISPTKVATGKKGTVTVTITGTNLGDGSRVLLGQSIAATKVKATGETKLVATFNKKDLTKNKKYTLTVINGDGGQVEYRSLKAK